MVLAAQSDSKTVEAFWSLSAAFYMSSLCTVGSAVLVEQLVYLLAIPILFSSFGAVYVEKEYRLWYPVWREAEHTLVLSIRSRLRVREVPQ